MCSYIFNEYVDSKLANALYQSICYSACDISFYLITIFNSVCNTSGVVSEAGIKDRDM